MSSALIVFTNVTQDSMVPLANPVAQFAAGPAPVQYLLTASLVS